MYLSNIRGPVAGLKNVKESEDSLRSSHNAPWASKCLYAKFNPDETVFKDLQERYYVSSV